MLVHRAEPHSALIAWDEATAALYRQLYAERAGFDYEVHEARIDSLCADRIWLAFTDSRLQSPFGVGLGL